MQKLLLFCVIVLLSGAGPALAQPAYQFAEAGTKNFITEASIVPGEQISLDLWLTDVDARQNAGGAWIDFSGSINELSYVSGGRCIVGGAEGCTGPWQANAGVFINEPEGDGGGPGTVLYLVANLVGAAPDGDGDLIVGTLTLESSAPGNADVDLIVIPGTGTWAPIPDASVVPATLSLSQPSTTTTVPGGTTTTSMQGTSSTTSATTTPPCLVEQVYGADSVEVVLGRYLRDRVLRKTPEGRELITIYYAWSPHLVSVLEDDAALKDQVKKVLDQILLLIKHEKD